MLVVIYNEMESQLVRGNLDSRSSKANRFLILNIMRKVASGVEFALAKFRKESTYFRASSWMKAPCSGARIWSSGSKSRPVLLRWRWRVHWATWARIVALWHWTILRPIRIVSVVRCWWWWWWWPILIVIGLRRWRRTTSVVLKHVWRRILMRWWEVIIWLVIIIRSWWLVIVNRKWLLIRLLIWWIGIVWIIGVVCTRWWWRRRSLVTRSVIWSLIRRRLIIVVNWIIASIGWWWWWYVRIIGTEFHLIIGN